MLLSKRIGLSVVIALFLLNIAKSQTPRIFLSVETYAGSLNSTGNENGSRLNSRWNGPVDMVFDNAGNLYIAEQFNHTIRIMSPDGNVSDFVGSSGNTGFVDGLGTGARFNEIRGITLDNDGNLLVADKENHAIRKVTPAGVVTTIAGTGVSGFLDGPGGDAMFQKPNEVLVNSTGEIFIADTGNNRIRKIDSDGNVSTLIGNGVAGYMDGNITEATLSNPAAIDFDSSGNLILTVRRGLRKYDFVTKEISTITGGPDNTVFRDGDRNTAGFDSIIGLFVDEDDVFYIVERHAIRHVSLNGDVTTLSGSGSPGTLNGAPLEAGYHFPRGMVKDSEGNFLIADRASQRIRRVFTAPAEATLQVTGPFTAPNTGIGLTSILEISLDNIGNTDLIIDNITYPEGFSGPFTDIIISPSESYNLSITFSPSEAKNYSGNLVITSNGGNTEIILAGIGELITSVENELPETVFVKLYPNPAKDYIEIDLSSYNARPLDLRIYDLSGTQKLSISNFNQSTLKIDLSTYKNGMYVITLKDKESSVIKKFLVKK